MPPFWCTDHGVLAAMQPARPHLRAVFCCRESIWIGRDRRACLHEGSGAKADGDRSDHWLHGSLEKNASYAGKHFW